MFQKIYVQNPILRIMNVMKNLVIERWKRHFDNWNQMFIAFENENENDFSFGYSRRKRKYIDLQSRSDIMVPANSKWPLFINVPNSTPTSYTSLSSGCCSTLMHALFRWCIHSLFMSWSIDVNRPRSVSEHVAMTESESGGQTKYMLPVRSFQKNIANRM